MDDVVAKSFVSPLSLDEMFEALSARVSGVSWNMGESGYEGDYVKGVTSEDVTLRILKEGGNFCVEVYFPLSDDAKPLLAAADKRAFMKRLDGHVLTAVKAKNVKDA